ncbi:MAG: hypothetical protein JOY71_07640 [Acetobacteraceae bacterium]|nr:hypothetical protein [Acetobacteraceae bacterium]
MDLLARFPHLRFIFSEGRTAELLVGLRKGTVDAVLSCLTVAEGGLNAAARFFEPFLLPPGQRGHVLAG